MFYFSSKLMCSTNCGFTRNIELYSEYWIINYTKLPLFYSNSNMLIAGQVGSGRVSNVHNNLCYSMTSELALRAGNDNEWTKVSWMKYFFNMLRSLNSRAALWQ